MFLNKSNENLIESLQLLGKPIKKTNIKIKQNQEKHFSLNLKTKNAKIVKYLVVKNKILFYIGLILILTSIITAKYFYQNKTFVYLQQKTNLINPIINHTEKQTKLTKEQQRTKEILSKYVSKKYFIDPKAADYILTETIKTSEKYNLETTLLLAIVAKESRFNPIAYSIAGAKGLVQYMPKAHPEKLEKYTSDSNKLISMSETLQIGGQILREYLNKFNNNVVLALQQYNGSLYDNQKKYSTDVLKIKQKFDQEIKNI